MARKLNHRLAYRTALVLFAVLAVFVIQLARRTEAYADVSMVCECTGSTQGFRQWRFGGKTKVWYEASPLEKLIAADASEAVVHRWTSYQNMHSNIFGRPLVFACGFPGEIMQFRGRYQEQWIARHSREEVRRLYDQFVNGSRDEQDRRITSIIRDLMIDEAAIAP